LGRFLYLLPPSPLGYRRLASNPVPEGVRDAYAAGLRAMLDWEPATDEHGDERSHLLHLDEKARSEHHAFAQAIEVQMQPGRDLEHFTDWVGKAPSAATRLAGVLHGIEHAHGTPWEAEITAKTMNAALEIMAVIQRPAQHLPPCRQAKRSPGGAGRARLCQVIELPQDGPGHPPSPMVRVRPEIAGGWR